MRNFIALIVLCSSLVPLSLLQGCGWEITDADPLCEDPKSPGYMKDPGCLEGMIDAGSDGGDSGDDGAADSG